MLIQFHSSDLNYQQQLNHIKEILFNEGYADLKNPHPNDMYLYWDNPSLKAQGIVQLAYDAEADKYILTNIADAIDADLLEQITYQGNEALYFQSLQQFYQDIYLKLQQLFPSQDILEVHLHKLELNDTVWYGCWPYDSIVAGIGEEYHKAMLDLTDKYKMFKGTMNVNQSVH